jgi:hypothetical protein
LADDREKSNPRVGNPQINLGAKYYLDAKGEDLIDPQRSWGLNDKATPTQVSGLNIIWRPRATYFNRFPPSHCVLRRVNLYSFDWFDKLTTGKLPGQQLAPG